MERNTGEEYRERIDKYQSIIEEQTQITNVISNLRAACIYCRRRSCGIFYGKGKLPAGCIGGSTVSDRVHNTGGDPRASSEQEEILKGAEKNK